MFDFENILIYFGLTGLIAGVYLKWGLAVSLMTTGVSLLLFAWIIARGSHGESTKNRK